MLLPAVVWGTSAFQMPKWTPCVCVCSFLSDSLWSCGLYPARLLCPWDSPGENTRVGCHFLLREIFPIWRSNPGLHLWQVDSLPLSHPESLKSTPVVSNLTVLLIAYQIVSKVLWALMWIKDRIKGTQHWMWQWSHRMEVYPHSLSSAFYFMLKAENHGWKTVFI